MLWRNLVLLCACLAFCITARAELPVWDSSAQMLAEPALGKKIEAIGQLQAVRDERILPLLSRLMDGELYVVKKQDDAGEHNRIVLRNQKQEGIEAIDAVTGESLGLVDSYQFKKIMVNNAFRKPLRGVIASFELTSSKLEVRKNAAENLVKSVDAQLLPQIVAAIAEEKDDGVRETLVLAKGLIEINSPEVANRLVALDSFAGILKPEVVAILEGVVAKNDDGSYREPDAGVRKRAREILGDTQFRIDFYKIVENLFFGVSLGSVLLLAAVGLAITFGVMGVINMAHGEMIMLGAYTTYVVQLLMPDALEYSLFVAIPAAFLVSGLVGIAIERGVIRFLYGRPLETLLATFGISLVLQQAVRSIFSPLNRSVATPQWMSGSWEVNGALSLTYNRLYIIIFAMLVLVGLALLLRRTMFGLQMRAVTQNRAMARSMGIRSGWVDAMTFGLGSGIAGIAGVALSQLTNVGPNLGQSYIIDSFMVVVFGGAGNLLGTFFAAMSLGVANKVLEPWSGAVMAKILMLVFIILFIQKRPRGMFAQKGRAVEH